MADYKDILMGTLKTLADKVKDVAENSSVKDVYAQGAGRAKTYGSIAKLSLEINGDMEELKRVYAEIGKLYYEQSKDSPVGFFGALFTQVEELNGKVREKQEYIDALRAELEAQRAARAEADIEVDIEYDMSSAADAFEDVVEDTEKDGAGLE